MKTFCYHGRDGQDRKLFSGTQHAETMEEAAEIISRQYGVRTLALSGGYWVNKHGEEIRLYLSVLPDLTQHGAQLIAEARQRQAEEIRKREEREEAVNEQLAQKIEELVGAEKVLEKLSQL